MAKRIPDAARCYKLKTILDLAVFWKEPLCPSHKFGVHRYPDGNVIVGLIVKPEAAVRFEGVAPDLARVEDRSYQGHVNWASKNRLAGAGRRRVRSRPCPIGCQMPAYRSRW